jgi:hypothetical protein
VNYGYKELYLAIFGSYCAFGGIGWYGIGG